MPKRKRDNDYDRIKKKIKRLEKKLRRSRRRDGYDSSDESSHSTPNSRHSLSETQDNRIIDEVLSDDEITRPADFALPSTSSAMNFSSKNTQSDRPDAPASTANIEPPALETASEEVVLDGELLEILGTDPSTEKKYGKDIHKDLSVRFEHVATSGITKEIRKTLKETYPTPGNCKLIDPPELNPEIKAAVSDTVNKRDKAIEAKQRQLTVAITCVGEAITMLLSSKDVDTTLLKVLMDAARILCDCQHADTITRRNFLLSAVKRDMKEQLQNTKVDKFLFSETLADTLKSARAINKSGAELKIPIPKTTVKKSTQTTTNSQKNLNWRSGPARRQPGLQRTKEPAATTTSTRNLPTSSSKQSSRQPHRPTYNRR